MRNRHERLERLLRQQENLTKQIIELQREMLESPARTKERSWPKGRLSKKRAHIAIQIILREEGGQMNQEDLFNRICEEGWHPQRSDEFFAMSPNEQEDIARKAFNGSMTAQLRDGKLVMLPGSIVSFPVEK